MASIRNETITQIQGTIDYSFPSLTEDRMYASGTAAVAFEIVHLSGSNVTKLAASGNDPYGILLEAVDATSAAQPVKVLIFGHAIESEVTSSNGTVASRKAALRDKGVYLT